ncbi:protein PTCD3 homolog, mitochondrial-like [Limulus polyphemus]|uniref:Small ribosomal subunit protein mS39 n=1 Tax=Limulus polyphemus TaxID=6850 RepID=A0ABM1BBY6_LIMPO|nr:protein PTCD3 homolog, mitochondrial-like [Limulus polyphemus]
MATSLRLCVLNWKKNIFKSRFFSISNYVRNLSATESTYEVTVKDSDALRDEKWSVKEEIVIPKRIPRGPTDILKALAATVDRDFTAPHYKYHDDPYFIPASNVTKRSFALSKESGRKAAKYFLEKYPDSFKNNPAEPNIQDLMPVEKITDDSEISEDFLLDCIHKVEVQNAIAAYKNIKEKNVSLSHETEQFLLELLCFFNCEESPGDQFSEEQWFKKLSVRETRKTWKDNGLAEQLFASMEKKDSQAYCALLQGRAKYFDVERAYDLYQKMQEKQIPANTETYNSLLTLVPFLREGSDGRWSLALEFLENMKRERLFPNIGTFNALLEILSKFGLWRSAKPLALKVMAEMKLLNIEPSLGSYYYLLTIFCKTSGPTSPILIDIMQNLEDKDLKIRHPKDVFFFVTAMDVCHNHLVDKKLAYRVHALLQKGNNYCLIGDSFRESIYYQHFFRLLCKTENIDVFLEFYNKYVPHIYTPEPSVMLDIIETIDLHGALHYLPQLWSDIIVFNHAVREQIVTTVLSIMARGTEDLELQKQFGVIAWDIKERIDSQEPRMRSQIQWTGQMLGDIMMVCLNAGEMDKAWEMMLKLDKEQDRIIGNAKSESLKRFCLASLEHGKYDQAIFCLKHAMEVGHTDIGNLMKEQLKHQNFTEMQEMQIQSLLNPETVENEQITE